MFEKLCFPHFDRAVMPPRRIRLISKIPFSQECSGVEIHPGTLKIVLSASDTTLCSCNTKTTYAPSLHCPLYIYDKQKVKQTLYFEERIGIHLRADGRFRTVTREYDRIGIKLTKLSDRTVQKREIASWHVSPAY